MISPKDKLPFLDFEILHLYTSYDIACVEASSEFKTLVRTMGDHEPRINQFQFMLMLCIFRPYNIILMLCTLAEKKNINHTDIKYL